MGSNQVGDGIPKDFANRDRQILQNFKGIGVVKLRFHSGRDGGIRCVLRAIVTGYVSLVQLQFFFIVSLNRSCKI